MNRAFSAGVYLCTNSWGAAPGYNESRAFGGTSIFVVAKLHSRGGRAPRLQQIEPRRVLWRPGILLEIDRDNRVTVTHQNFAKHGQIERVVLIWQVPKVSQC